MSKDEQRKVKSTHTLQKLLALIVGLGCIVALWRLCSLLIFEVNPLHHGGDGLIYTTVGRGITQGLVPYRDLFEFKPPGMFLIVAVSLFLTKGMAIANALQGLTELGIIILMQALAWRTVKHVPSRIQRWNLLGGTFIFSVLLLLQLVDRAGHFQTESIGTFLILLFAFLVTMKKPLRPLIAVFGALVLMIAIGIKEPFVFTGFCVLLLLLPFKQVLKTYTVTLGIAIIVGIILMTLLGYLIPYLTIYLPELLGPRLHYWKDPWWSNGFYLAWIMDDLWSFSPPLLVAVALGIIGATLSLANFQKASERKGLILFMSISAVLWWSITRVTLSYATQYQELDTLLPFVAVLTTAFVAIVYVGYRKYFPESYRQGCSAMLKTYGGMYIIGITVSLGGHLPQQFGFGTAFYAVAFVVSLAGVTHMESKFVRTLFSLSVVMSCLGLLIPLPRQDFDRIMQERVAFNAQQQKSAQVIDDIMDACSFDRYVIIGEPPVPWGFTKHTPYGPAFSRSSFTYPVEWREPPIAYLQDTYFANLRKTSILVTPKRDSVLVDLADVPQNIVVEFAKHFGVDPPECAKGFVARMKEQPFLFFFRKNLIQKVPAK